MPFFKLLDNEDKQSGGKLLTLHGYGQTNYNNYLFVFGFGDFVAGMHR